ncbi:hypothetical protein JDS92_19345 [Bacillus cereus group sp. N12]|uniref:hypothetical protein n=1 Tax=Bacillus cereus group sp. N12 TaxID=2794586 RepID=UPI0018F3C807|nr:hypothetical protein [Bacillus cereus group sp. N12]MBJ8077500.1 hypothetical protein [Bacillus cereus group sp. N12]
MPQVGLYVAGAASGIGGVGILLAWDRFDRGPSAADDLDTNGCGLYSWIAPTTGALLAKMKTNSPIQIPEENCPTYPDGFPGGDFVNRLEVKPGGTALTPIGDFSLDIFDGSTRKYSAAPEGTILKFEVSSNSILSTAVSIQDRPTLQPWEDSLEGFAAFFTLLHHDIPSKELWRELMTPNRPLEWW